MLGIPGCAVVVVKNRRRRSMVKVDEKDKNYWLLVKEDIRRRSNMFIKLL